MQGAINGMVGVVCNRRLSWSRTDIIRYVCCTAAALRCHLAEWASLPRHRSRDRIRRIDLRHTPMAGSRICVSPLTNQCSTESVAHNGIGSTIPIRVTAIIRRDDQHHQQYCRAAPSKPSAPRLGALISRKPENHERKNGDAAEVDECIHAPLLVHPDRLLNCRHTKILNKRANAGQRSAGQ